MNKQKRWILLEHFPPHNDPIGNHFDLLLEDKNGCRSWRLEKDLVLDGLSQEAVPTPFHRLEWLSVTTRQVSGGRGLAKKVSGGFFYGDLPIDENEEIQIKLIFDERMALLEIQNCMCRLRSL